jgi:hypothetical protein
MSRLIAYEKQKKFVVVQIALKAVESPLNIQVLAKITERRRQNCYDLRTFPNLLSHYLHVGLLNDFLLSGFSIKKKLCVFHLSQFSFAHVMPNYFKPILCDVLYQAKFWRCGWLFPRQTLNPEGHILSTSRK